MLCAGLVAPMGLIAEQPKAKKQISAAKHVKKAAKIAGYSALAVGGAGISAFTSVVTFRHVAEKLRSGDQIDIKDEAIFGAGISAVTLPGLAMIYFGLRGLKKTIYGQTEGEKKAEQEQKDKIKETVQTGAKVTFDISKRGARVTGYSLLTAFGAALLPGSVGTFVNLFTDHTKSFLSKDRVKSLSFEQAQTNWNQDNKKEAVGGMKKEAVGGMKKEVVVGMIGAPMGACALVFGIRGLIKEYKDWKKSKTRETIVDAVQSVKDAVVQTATDAVDAIIPVIEEKE